MPELHVCGLGHVPQFTETPQLSCSGPQRLVQKLGSELHTQTFPASTAHVCEPPQAPQPTVIPQLSGPVPQCVVHQLRSGVQPSAGASLAASASIAPSFAASVAPSAGPSSWLLPSALPVSCVVWSTATTSCVAASSYGRPSSMPQIFAQPKGVKDAKTHSAAIATLGKDRAPRTIRQPL